MNINPISEGGSHNERVRSYKGAVLDAGIAMQGRTKPILDLSPLLLKKTRKAAAGSTSLDDIVQRASGQQGHAIE
jgi:hypothetical protein